MKKKSFILLLLVMLSWGLWANALPELSETSAMVPTIKTVTLASGLTLEYVEQGHPRGEVIIFLHGYTDSSFSYSRVLPLLPLKYHAYALTMRGHGNSDKPAAGYTMDDFSSDVAAFMEALNIQKAVITGHSMGSFVALHTAVNYPDKVKGIILIGSAPKSTDNEVLLGLQEYVNTLTDPIDREFVYDFQASTVNDPVPEEFLNTVVDESLKVPAHIWISALAGLMQADYTNALAQIDVPALIFWGTHDGIFTLEEQTTLGLEIPDTVLRLYKETGHGLHWEKPERFTKDMVLFLQQF